MRRQLLVLCAGLTCLAASFPEYTVKSANEYANMVTKSGIAVGAIPMEDPQDQTKYFGINLRSKRLVPIFLVIENQTAADSYFFRKDKLSYSSEGRSASTLSSSSASSKIEKALAVGSYAPYYGIVAMAIASKSKELRQNLLKRELQTTTLSLHASTHGFVFIPAHWKHSSRETIHLVIRFARSGNDEIVVLDLAL
jgi:hypothetical protein